MALHIPHRFRNKFVCSVWVGFVLGKSGVNHNIKKHPSLIEPEDFRSIRGAELVYRGDLKKYRSFVLANFSGEEQITDIGNAKELHKSTGESA